MQVNNTNQPIPPRIIQPPVGMAFAGPTFSYNIPQSGVGVPANQQFQSSMVRVDS